MGLSTLHEDYLRVIWKLREWQEKPVILGDLIRTSDLFPSTASEEVQRLVSIGLVRCARYGSISLIEAGRDEAVRMARTHRLTETRLMTIFGRSQDEVHDGTEHLEHAASVTFVERPDAALGHPRHDPHGDPIPRPGGSLSEDKNAVSLELLGPGEAGVAHRIYDTDSVVLRELAGIGLVLGTRVSIVNVKRGLGLMRVSMLQTSVDISLSVADAVSVTHWRCATIPVGSTRPRLLYAPQDEAMHVGLGPGLPPQTACSLRAAHDSEVDKGKIDWDLRLPHIRQRVDDVLEGIDAFATTGVVPLSCHTANIAVRSNTFSPCLRANSPQSSNRGLAAPWYTLTHVGAMRISFQLAHLE